MDNRNVFAPLLLTVVFAGCQAAVPPPASEPEPPVAKTVDKELEIHGDVRVDPYYWLNERDNPDVIQYLEAENAYTAAMMAHTQGLQDTLVKEFEERIQQTDSSAPYRLGDYLYYERSAAGKDYKVYCRKKGSLEAQEEVMLDANVLAEGHGFFAVGKRMVSPGQDVLAYPVDVQGRRFYTVRFKNLITGEDLADEIPNVTPNVAWANDNQTVFYTRQDPVTLRWYQIWRHTMGTDPGTDALIYQEDDETFECGVERTKSEEYLLVECTQTLSAEVRYLDADDPRGELTLIQPRERNLEYQVDHLGDHFYIRTNLEAQNFQLMKTPVASPGKESWTEVVGHRDDVLLEGFELFQDYLVVRERKEGLLGIRIRPWFGSEEYELDFGEPAYDAFTRDNFILDTSVLRYQYESLTTPDSVFDFDMATREKTLIKQDELGGGFASESYVTQRLFATARDGARVPVSLVHRQGLELDGQNPLLLYGYGSYGSSIDASFDPYVVSLMDRGFVYAIAHIRGGEEMGRQWYEDGKLFNKKNTFFDFIDCGKFLVDQGYTSPDRLFARGGSAGGLLIGAVVNYEPELFQAVIAGVPFVDVVTTMLDESIPLTTSEFDEWGDPRIQEYYDYMKSYSPYDNVEARDYPSMLVTTAFHDSQVQYFEPAKWVARLRALKTDSNPLLLRCDMEAGHGGVSGRQKQYRKKAFDYAFLLDQAEIEH